MMMVFVQQIPSTKIEGFVQMIEQLTASYRIHLVEETPLEPIAVEG